MVRQLGFVARLQKASPSRESTAPRRNPSGGRCHLYGTLLEPFPKLGTNHLPERRGGRLIIPIEESLARALRQEGFLRERHGSVRAIGVGSLG